jgi:hypothetical protein
MIATGPAASAAFRAAGIAVQTPGDETDRDARISGGGDFAPDRLGVGTRADYA